jgi:hypothetical protein
VPVSVLVKLDVSRHTDCMSLRKRGRPLLTAAVGVAAVSFVHCGGEDAPPPRDPVGNLRAPERVWVPEVDASADGGPVAADPMLGAGTITDGGSDAPSDAGAADARVVLEPTRDAGAVRDAGSRGGVVLPPRTHPVGNLRPPSR